MILQTILSAFGIGEQQGRTALQVITDYVRERNLLLVLDNCEHLIQACATLTDHLLNNSHELKILATSREALNVKGELTWHVPSLSLPDIKQLPALEHLTQYEAVQLFIERAILVQSNFSVTNDNAPFVAQICSRLDGIPLAIELAAARVRAMSVDQIAKRLDDRFRLLTGGSRTSLERHQTLRAAVDWSYNLLTDEEKKLFRSLAVFSGGWTLEAAESVCGQGGSGYEILDSLTQLVDKSLVNLDESRYRMLETIRQYAQEKLNEAGEVHLARMRHLNYFLAWGEQAEAGIKSREYFLWLERMDKERDNLRAALEYVISTGQAEAALRLIGATFWVWMTRGPWSEGQRWVEDALAIASEEHPAAKAKGLMALGSLLFNQGDLAEANQILKESLMIWQELGDKWWCAFVGSLLGLFLTRSNQPTDSTGVFQESLRLARGVNDPWLLVICLHLFTQHKIHLGKVAEARVLAEESIELIRILGGNFFEGDVIGDLGEIAEAEQDYPRALHWYQEGLNIGQKNNDLDSLTNFEFNMGCVFQKSGDHDQAACHFREALEVSFRSGKRIILVGAVTKLGILAQARGDLRRAVCLLQTGKSLLDNMDETIFGNSMRAEIEQSLEAVHTQLGEKEFSALMMEGQVMTIEQAVAYALEESK